MTKLKPDTIKAVNAAIDRVRSIDDTIQWLGEDAPDKVSEHGRKVREYLGRNRMGLFTDARLGEVVLVAVVNALLDQRQAIIEDYCDLVEFPDPPCPRQTLQETTND